MSADWKKVTLSNLASLSGGFAFRSKDYASSGRFILRTLNIREDGSISKEDAVYLPENLTDQYSRFELQPHDTLFVMVGATLGKVGFVRQSDLPALLNQNMWRVRAKSETTDQRFLHYAFRHGIQRNLAWAAGSARDFALRDDYRNLLIPTPPMEEQRAIGQILGALDDKIELNRRMNRTLEELATTLFRSWFVDFDPVVAKTAGRKPVHLRPEVAALFPAHFQDSELGPIPEGWRVAALSEIASINVRKLPRNYAHAEIEYLDISSVSEGVINGTTHVARTAAPSRAQRLVAHGDTIWSCVRPNRRSFAFIQDPPENLVVSTGFATLTPTCGSPAFIYTATTTDDFTDYLTAHAEGSAYPAVRPETFKKAPLIVPTTELLKQFEKIVSPWLAQVAHNIRESRTLAALRDTLLPKLLSGELRVKQAAKLVAAAS